MELNPEIFVIPNKRYFILYNPLAGSVLEVSSGVIKEMQNLAQHKNYSLNKNIKDKLIEKGFISENFPDIPKKYSYGGYFPTEVTLMPSWDCNLRCTYCYSNGGENPERLMDIKIAKASVNFIIKNALKTKTNQIHVGYHGAGEPLMEKNMSWIKEITHYSKEKANENNLKINITSATNGFLSKKSLEWIINNLNRINLSWDGPADIQNRQRPTKGGGSTYDLVLRTANYFEEKKFPYGIRTTITEESVHRMEEIVKHFIENTSLRSFHFEPLFECGRCKITKLKSPSTKDFIENSIKSKYLAERYGRSIFHSASELEKIGMTFCGASGYNFFVTPDGNVTTCMEVSRPNDDMNDIFIIGKFDNENNKFVFNKKRLNALIKRIVQNVKGCEDCFAKYNCSGDCLAKSYAVSRNLYNSKDNLRCETNKFLLLHEIKEKLKKNNDVNRLWVLDLKT